jgi:phytoene dehydrogenase-like protein
LGAILSQENEEGIEQPIAFASKSLNKAQHNYSATELELLAIVWAVTDKFRQFTLGREIIVTSDHEALKYMNRKESPTDSKRIQRWMIKLLGYDIDIRYRKGKENDNVDALSRLYSQEDQPINNGLERPEP